MKKIIVTIEDSLSKSYNFDTLVDKDTIIEDISHHYDVYEEYINNNLDDIVRCLSKSFLKVIACEIHTINVKFIEPQKKPFRIPLLMKRIYHAYYQSLIVKLEIETTDNINLLKLKNFELYNKLFSNDGHHLNIRTTNLIRNSIKNNVEYILK